MVRKRGIFMEEAVPANKGAMAAVIGLTGARTGRSIGKDSECMDRKFITVPVSW